MGKNISYLLIFLGVFSCCLPKALSQNASIDHFAPISTVAIGDTVDVYVSVAQLPLAFGIQGTINWDETILDFIDVPTADINLPGLTPPSCGAAICSFNDAFVADGQLLLAWFDFGGQTITAPDTVLYKMRFKALAAGNSSIFFDNDRIPFRVNEDGASEYEPATTNANITVLGNPNDPCAAFAEFGVIAASDSVATGDQVCLPISVCGFDNIIGLSYTMEFDPTQLQFDSISNITLSQLTTGQFGTTNAGNGFVNMNWFDSTGVIGVTLPDGSPIYEICFTALGAGGTTDTLHINSAQTLFDAVDTTQNSLIVDSTPGIVTITGSVQGSMSVYATNETCLVGGDTCVDVQVKNFEDMLSLSFTMEWDESVIGFDTILDPNNFFNGMISSSINSSPSLTDTGAFTVQWVSPNLGTTPVTLMDSTTIFQVCFTGDGTVGQTSTVEFTSSLTPEVAVQSDGGTGQNNISLVTTAGSVELFDNAPPTGFVFNLSDETGCTGDTVTLNYIATGFTDVNTISFALKWDTAALDFIGLHDNILPQTFFANTTPQFTDNGVLTVLWFDAANSLSIDNDTIILQFDFLVEGPDATTTTVSWDSHNTTTLNVGDDLGPLPFTTNNGVVTIDCGVPTPTLSLVISNLDCFEDNSGEIDVTVLNGTAPLTFDWSGPNGFSEDTEDITGLEAGTYNLTFTDGLGTVIMDAFTVTEPDSIIITLTSSTDASCNGGTDGSLDITVTQSVGALTYTWDNGLPAQEDQTGLSAGTYCVTVEDGNSCEAEACFTINELNAPTLSAVETDASCNAGNDGAIDLTVTGGSGSNMFMWDNGLPAQEDQAGLMPGTYCVTVTDSGNCAVNACYTISQANLPTLSDDITDVTCNGDDDGEIDLTVTGGTGTLVFMWDNGLPAQEDQTGLAPGDYEVTLSDDAGCVLIETYTISEPALLSVSESHTDLDCNGDNNGTINLTVSGGTGGYDFAWDNGLPSTQNQSGLSGGTYTVTVTDDNDCEDIISVVIDEPTQLSVTGIVVDDSGLIDGEIDITVLGGTTAYNFSWSGPNSFSSNNGDLTGLAAGIYNLTIQDANDCEIQETFTVGGPAALSIDDFDITDAGCASISNGAIDITVSGGTGTISFSWDDAGNSSFEDLSNVPSGTYSVTVSDQANNQVIGGPYTIGQATTITYTEMHTNTTCSDRDDGTITLNIQGGSGNYDVDWNGGFVGEMITGLPAGVYTPVITDTNGCEETGAAININAADPLDLQVVQVTDVVCFGDATGSITVIASGGAPNANLAVTWSPTNTGLTLNNLTANDYTPTVTDVTNGCVMMGSAITVDQPNSPIRANEVITNISCNGETDGEVRIAATGGNGQLYDYTWNPALNAPGDDDLLNVGPGDYFLTIADNQGCEENFGPFTVVEPNPITAQAFIDPASSSNDDGKITLVVSGGNPNYDFDWVGPNGSEPNDNVISNLESGEYDVTITDENDCEFTATYIVEGEIGATYFVNDVSCFGLTDGSIMLNSISGGMPPYSFEWSGPSLGSNVFTQDLLDVAPGTYIVTISDSDDLFRIQNYTVGEPAAIAVAVTNVIHETGFGCNGSISVTASNGQGPYEYIWSHGGSSSTVNDLCKGDYSVQVRDEKNCSVESEIITIDPAALGVTNFEEINGACFQESNGEVCFEYFGGCGPYTITFNGVTQVDLDNSLCFSDLAGGAHSVLILDNEGQSLNYNFTVTQYSQITATTEITDNTDPTGAACNGFINLTPAGGMAPYTFQWSHGPTSEDVSDLCEDLSPYNVTITDSNGCFMTITGLEVGLGVSATATIMDVCDESIGSCDGAIFVDDPEGGVGPYTYLWSTGAVSQNLIDVCAGTYDLEIFDSAGGSVTYVYNVSAPTNPLTITEILVTPSSSGTNGSIDIEISGGYGQYQIDWDSGQGTEDIAGLSPGTYVVNVIDMNGCMAIASFTVDGNGPGQVTFVQSDINCSGDAGCLEAILPLGVGTGPFQYLWSTGDITSRVCDLLQNEEYSVTITDFNGLIFTGTGSITGPDPIEVEVDIDTDLSTLTANATGGSGIYSYLWDPIPDITQEITYGTPGTYSVIVTDDNGCVGSEVVEVETDGECTDVRNIISPNNDGENDEFIIACAYRYLDNELSIFNRWGQLVFQEVGYSNDWEGIGLDNEMVPSGGYFYVYEYRDPNTGLIVQLKGHLTIIRR